MIIQRAAHFAYDLCAFCTYTVKILFGHIKNCKADFIQDFCDRRKAFHGRGRRSSRTLNAEMTAGEQSQGSADGELLG